MALHYYYKVCNNIIYLWCENILAKISYFLINFATLSVTILLALLILLI